ncbi:MAG TPA: polysaccharide biosynthesis/export family protein, partial [Opitutaceae bacterium]|nr:polysaccharide biosynthesis/export family protein [Opitutaceae bacterium]
AAATEGAGTPAIASTREEWEMAVLKVRQLDSYLGLLISRQRAIQVFKESPPGNFREMQPANPETVSRNDPYTMVALLSAFCGVLGMIGAGAELLRRELFDTRLKTEADVARVTALPVLANLGDIRQMSLATRETWAFRAWIALQDRLAFSPNHGLICGITSSNSGDGRSTWINLLAGAARKCGFRVLTIATRPTADAPAVAEEVNEPRAEARVEPMTAEAEAEPVGAMAGEREHAGARTATRESASSYGRAHGGAHGGANGSANGSTNGGANGHSHGTSAILSNPTDLTGGAQSFAGESEFTAMTASALFTPAMVTEKLLGSETDPLVHIPLPGWTWNLERRKQWQGALNVWRKIDNVVILVELPPASMPESVLLASNLPNLLWLVEAGKSDAIDTRAQLQTLRHARCNLVGSVINRAMAPVAGGKFSRWVGCLAMCGLLGLVSNGLMAAEAADVPPSPTGAATFSVVSPTQRAQWQQKLTLGPGDVLNLSLYGDPDALRELVPVGPDGRVSYLEAQNVQAAGLTVDEFREKLNQELGKFRRAPQAYVVPVTYKSKKYFVLGKVAQRGSFPLDRPMTLLEAVARSGGLETGLAIDRSMVELADLSRSFIARKGQRLPVDFEKLFAHGDLSQNITLEPDDYIYFPGNGDKEVYVLGAVRAPGSYVYSTTTGALGAIASRGGFSDRAWKKKVAIIRGGMGKPEFFELDATQILTAQAADMKLQPKDIVFVSERPWIRAEELLDAAANAFVTAAVLTWTGEHVTR